VFPHLEARVRIGCGIPNSKDSLSLLMVQYSKDIRLKKTVVLLPVAQTKTIKTAISAQFSQQPPRGPGA
jgi:hypothetical protein